MTDVPFMKATVPSWLSGTVFILDANTISEAQNVQRHHTVMLCGVWLMYPLWNPLCKGGFLVLKWCFFGVRLAHMLTPSVRHTKLRVRICCVWKYIWMHMPIQKNNHYESHTNKAKQTNKNRNLCNPPRMIVFRLILYPNVLENVWIREFQQGKTGEDRKYNWLR